jgi:hypothetical protein
MEEQGEQIEKVIFCINNMHDRNWNNQSIKRKS